MAAKVYVSNLSWNTTDESLSEVFGQFGDIIDAIVMKDGETGRSRGFGFVSFSSSVEAEAAVAGMNEQELDGHRLRMNLANASGG
ncbi:hypothetical protein EDD22DRAFT_918480 [Suillus occidentalis]|nr:hypothetical protein EDD22DRAFT_918480 [Suillus occidentalis]